MLDLPRLRVAGPELTQSVVEQLSPLRRSLFEDGKILRAEQDRIQNAVQILAGGLFHAGEKELAGPSAREHDRFQTLLPIIGENPCLQGGEFRPEADQLGLLAGAEGRAAAEVADGLQQIRLALGVLTHEEIDSRVKFDGLILVVAEARQTQIEQLHWPCPTR